MAAMRSNIEHSNHGQEPFSQRPSWHFITIPNISIYKHRRLEWNITIRLSKQVVEFTVCLSLKNTTNMFTQKSTATQSVHFSRATKVDIMTQDNLVATYSALIFFNPTTKPIITLCHPHRNNDVCKMEWRYLRKHKSLLQKDAAHKVK